MWAAPSALRAADLLEYSTQRIGLFLAGQLSLYTKKKLFFDKCSLFVY